MTVKDINKMSHMVSGTEEMLKEYYLFLHNPSIYRA